MLREKVREKLLQFPGVTEEHVSRIVEAIALLPFRGVMVFVIPVSKEQGTPVVLSSEQNIDWQCEVLRSALMLLYGAQDRKRRS